jgi:hypothetical protein
MFLVLPFSGQNAIEAVEAGAGSIVEAVAVVAVTGTAVDTEGAGNIVEAVAVAGDVNFHPFD